MSPKEIAKLLAEEEVKINDNEIYSILHHVEDAIEAFEQGKRQVVLGSLKDIQELASELYQKLSPGEQTEIGDIEEDQFVSPTTALDRTGTIKGPRERFSPQDR